jgi:hypothetical protein
MVMHNMELFAKTIILFYVKRSTWMLLSCVYAINVGTDYALSKINTDYEISLYAAMISCIIQF